MSASALSVATAEAPPRRANWITAFRRRPASLVALVVIGVLVALADSAAGGEITSGTPSGPRLSTYYCDHRPPP